MSRSVVLGVLVALGAVSMTIRAAQQPAGGQPAPRVVEVEKLRDNLYVMKGGGGKSAVFITATGVVVVDTNKEFAAAVQAGKKAGRTVDEVAGSWTIPAKYQGYAAPAAVRLKSNVQVVFDETK